MEKIQGIYVIANKINHKLYVGSSSEITARWSTHKYTLRNGTHANKHFQRAWNEYGEDAFVFIVVEKIDDLDSLETREIEWIKNLNVLDSTVGYNKVLDAKGYMRDKKLSEDAIRKRNTINTIAHHQNPVKQLRKYLLG